jgi:hypothetical protein
MFLLRGPVEVNTNLPLPMLINRASRIAVLCQKTLNPKYQYFLSYSSNEPDVENQETIVLNSKLKKVLADIKSAPGAYFLVALVWTVLIGGGIRAIYQKYERHRFDAIINGKVHGNSKTNVFHVPTCPNYLAIEKSNLVIFETVEQAEEAGLRGSGNCTDEVDIRRTVEASDFEMPEQDYERPY